MQKVLAMTPSLLTLLELKDVDWIVDTNAINTCWTWTMTLLMRSSFYQLSGGFFFLTHFVGAHPLTRNVAMVSVALLWGARCRFLHVFSDFPQLGLDWRALDSLLPPLCEPGTDKHTDTEVNYKRRTSMWHHSLRGCLGVGPRPSIQVILH